MARLRHVIVLCLFAGLYLVAAVRVDDGVSPIDPEPAAASDERWRPPAAADLPDGTALYFEGGRGPGGRDPLFVRATPRTAAFGHRTLEQGTQRFTVEGSRRWIINLAPPDAGRWEPGVYPLQSGSDALLWGPDHTTCTDAQPGWLAIDAIAYDDAGLARIDLRAAQPCSTAQRDYVKRLALRWNRDAPAAVAANPRTPPWQLWRPHADDVPAARSYAALTAAPAGGDDPIAVTDGSPRVYTSTERHTYRLQWSDVRIDIAAPAPLQPGYYGGLRSWGSADNPALGGLSVAVGAGCANSAGWLQVDDVGHTGSGGLQRLTARFGIRCDRGGAPVHGVVRWTRDGTRPAAAPPPTGRPGPPPARSSGARSLTSACFFVPDAGTFDDVAGANPHRLATECAARRGIVTGVSDTRFAPDETLTRAQMAAMLARLRQSMVGGAAPTGTSDTDAFVDIAGLAHEDAIRAVAAAGIARGYADGKFRPSRPVQRGHLATFVARLLLGDDPRPQRADVFRDDDGTTHEAAIDMIALAGIVEGGPDAQFDPTAPVSRAQAASFMARTAAQLTDMGMLTTH